MIDRPETTRNGRHALTEVVGWAVPTNSVGGHSPLYSGLRPCHGPPHQPCVRSALMIVCLFSLLAVAGCANGTNGTSDEEPQSDGPSKEHPVSVQAARAERTTLHPRLDLVGTIVAIPERTAVVSPQVAGWVDSLKVVEGQSVHAGDVLVQLDARSSQTAMKRAQALVAEKSAALQRLKRGYLPQEIAAARQDADKAAANVAALRNELAALKDLLDRREISAVQYETKQKAVQAAQAARNSAEERAKLLEAGTRPEMIDEAQGVLDAAQADLDQAQLNLQWCTIASPIDGVVVQLLARRGQFFDRAAPLATINDLSELFVQLRVPSAEFGKVQLGTPVDVELTSLPGRTFQGTVTRIGGQADPLTGNVVVFALVKNEGGTLRPGLSCQARVWLPEIPDVLAVPVAAVADHSGTPVVTVIRDGKAYETEVTLGAETPELVAVLKGLSAGNLVATAGGYGLPEGCPVRIVSDSAAKTTEGR